MTQACHDDTCEAEEVLKQIKRFEEGSAGDLKRELLGRHTVRLGHSAQGITGHHRASQRITEHDSAFEWSHGKGTELLLHEMK